MAPLVAESTERIVGYFAGPASYRKIDRVPSTSLAVTNRLRVPIGSRPSGDTPVGRSCWKAKVLPTRR